MSISLNGVSHHLVSYYTVEDVKQRKLQRPLTDTRLNGIAIRPELYLKQNFRAPVEEQDQFAVDHSGHAYPQLSGYSHMVAPSGYMMRQSYVAPGYPPMYGAAPVSTGPGVYSSLPATAPAPAWPQSYSAAAPSQQSYNAYYSRADASTPQTSATSYTPMPPMQSQYQSPMRTSAQSYGPPSSMTTSSTPVATQSQYQPTQTATASQYQPPPSYGVQTNSHQSASPQQQSMRSPPVGPPPQSMNVYPPRSNLPGNLPSMSSYRQYSNPGPQGEMPSIGMGSGYGSSHSQASNAGYGASSYGPPSGSLSAPQNYRHSSDAAPPVQGGQYYQDGKPAVSNYS